MGRSLGLGRPEGKDLEIDRNECSEVEPRKMGRTWW